MADNDFVLRPIFLGILLHCVLRDPVRSWSITWSLFFSVIGIEALDWGVPPGHIFLSDRLLTPSSMPNARPSREVNRLPLNERCVRDLSPWNVVLVTLAIWLKSIVRWVSCKNKEIYQNHFIKSWNHYNTLIHFFFIFTRQANIGAKHGGAHWLSTF